MPTALSCLVIFIGMVHFASLMIQQIPMPDGLKAHFDGAKRKHNVSDIPGEQIFWECMQRVMWQMSEQMGHNATRQTRDYLDRLLQLAVDPERDRFPRIRKEYRMMTDDERERFHKAIKELKEDKTLEPDVYSAVAELHAGEIISMAHFGAAFLGWHRVLLLIFETALRLKDPSVSIPYWASNMDAEMDDPTKSIIWSEKFLGNGDGFVTTGPFANFKAHTSDSILMRNIGVSGSLMTNEGIHGVLSQNRTADISNPRAPKQNNLELQHNTVHAWIGGNMDDLSQSCEDPVFYMHHAFVDYLWEEFRTRQKMVGIDPETDYPDIDWGEHQHAPDAPLGFGDLRNIDALSNVFADLVKYDPSPVCTRTHPTCISKFLRCDASRAYPVCVSLSREELNSETERPSELCVEAQMTRAVQNSFSINLHCDVRKWVYIPVKIVLQRPPEFSNYKAYPVLNNEPVRNTDVFSTISIDKNISHHLAAYPNCKITSSAARKIFIESNGLNYYGKYKDFTILDQRHALSSATTYLGVKSPESNHTDVIVTAFDYCGRTCRPFCLDITVSPPKSRPCSGVIRVTEDEPKQYGHNYAEAVNMRWSASGPDELPEEAPFHFITFYCDYSGHWPWDESIQRSVHGSKNIFNTPQLRESFDGHFQEKIPGIISPPPQFPHSHSHSTRLLPPPSLLPPTGPQAVSKSQNDKNESAKFTKPLIKTSPRITIIRAKSRRPDPKQEISLPAIQAAVSATRIPNIRTLNLSSATSRPAGQLHRRQQHPVPQQSLRQFHLSQTTPWNIATPLSQPAVVNTRQERLSTFTAPTSSNILFNQERFSDFLSQSPQRAPDMIAFRDGCRLNRACQLAMSCSPCRHKARQPCLPPSRLVAICLNGVYTVENRFVEFTG